ncbi:hypothetical protein EMIT0P43_200022 [Pseudomonas jessenii]
MPWQHQKYSSNALDAVAYGGLKWFRLSLNSIDFNFYRSILHTPWTLWERACSRKGSVSHFMAA